MSTNHDIEANRALVLRFLKEVVLDGDFSDIEALATPTYLQHSTLAADGVSGLKDFVQNLVVKEWPEREAIVHRTVAEGDMVVVHSHVIRWPGDRGLAAMDIFRVEDGKVAEHWDAVQEVPEHMLHDRGMF